MNKGKKLLCGIIGSAIVIAFGAYTIYNHDSFGNGHAANHEMTTDTKESEHTTKKKEVIVTYIAADGYSWLHVDHTHFKKGKIPSDAKFMQKTVMKDPNYKFNESDVKYEVDQGYIIEVNQEFYYYPKPGVKQTNIVEDE